MIRRPARLAPLPLLLAPLAWLAGCAEDGPYPSLAQRPAERQYAEEKARLPEPPAPVADDPAIASRIEALTREAGRGEEEFEGAYAAAAAAAALAGPSGSDSWASAQEALSRAAAAQGRTAGALAEFDRFSVERLQSGPLSPGDRARLAEATRDAQALADSQAARVKRLQDSLAR